MISQILFGEVYIVLDKTENWLKIKTVYDEYQGWISLNMHSPINEDFFYFYIREPKKTTTNLALISDTKGFEAQYIPHGSTLPAFDEKSLSFKLGDKTYRIYDKKSVGFEETNTFSSISLRFLNAPYLWGGKSIFGIDCSGFTQVVYKIMGIKLLRDAYQQFSQGEFITEFKEIKAGDLAFFGKSVSQITHVGIILDATKIIHASGKVKINNWDEIGIYDSANKEYTHKLVGIKRIRQALPET